MTVLFYFMFIGNVQQGKIYESIATIEGVGEITLPPGKWLLEYSINPEKKTNRPDVYVFKKRTGNRIERLTFERFDSHITHPLGAYFDSIGDGMNDGVPNWLNNDGYDYESVRYLCPIFEMEHTSGTATCMGASYLYSSESGNHWMSHAFVSDRNGWVLVCIHSSPYAISPDIVNDVFSQSEFESGTRDRKNVLRSDSNARDVESTDCCAVSKASSPQENQ